MLYSPKRVFILKNNNYCEISLKEFRQLKNNQLKDSFFVCIHGFLLEVTQEFYRRYYKELHRLKYIAKLDKEKLLSYNAWDTEDSNGEDVLVSADNVHKQVVDTLMKEKLSQSIATLTADEQLLLHRHYTEELSELQLSELYGITQQAINRRLQRIRIKLKKLLES